MKSVKGTYLSSLAFCCAFCFFQFAYPYHLIRREQMNLFLYDFDYIRQTYAGMGWLARLVSDFLEQFFHLTIAGPTVISFLLTAIGVVSYQICRKIAGRWPSTAVASVIFLWSFFRETGNLYVTRYTVVVLGYLSLLVLSLRFEEVWKRAVSMVLLFCFGIWALGSPLHKNYGKFWSTPKFEYERLIGLDAEVARENWDRVLKLSEKDLQMVEASYCYNLALAMKGELGDHLLDHSQGGPYDLLLRVWGEQSVFRNCLAGEAWFHLGALTIAEQSAITSLQASPNHTGARYIRRLAMVNLISGENAVARKYLNLLSKTLFYGRWARSMIPGSQSEAVRTELQKARSRSSVKDFVHLSNVPRSILLGLLEADSTNRPAREYLLCYDLMRYDLEQFMEDYTPDMIDARHYHEAALIWLDQKNILSEQTAAEYGADEAMLKRMASFFRMPKTYQNTYWYYFMTAANAYSR